MTSPTPTSWIIERFENGSALLKNGKDQFRVARALIPKNIKEGDVITADFYLLKDQKARQENLARALLEEILGKE